MVNSGGNSEKLESQLFWIDLAWFSNAEEEGRTEDPSDEKLRKAREEGRVARSQDLTAVFGLLGPFLILVLFFTYFTNSCLNLTASYFTHLCEWDVKQSNLALMTLCWQILAVVWPTLLVSFLVSIVVNIAQVGVFFTTKPLQVKWERVSLDFNKWLKRSFFSFEALFNLLKSLIKLTIIIGLGYAIIRTKLPSLLPICQYPLGVGLSVIAGVVVQLFLLSFVVLLIFALVDYAFQKRLFWDSVKMSKQELKEERKQSEGDPLLKSRLRERMRQIVNQNIRKVVPKADVVITNPTHYAVALEWDAQKMVAPQVLAKGKGDIALSIIKIAEQSQVPRVENRPLARALHASVEVGDTVPPEYWEMVSRILAEVYALNEKLKYRSYKV